MGKRGPAVFLSVGEASGDLHGATLCRALRELAPDIVLAGMGGPRMAAAGMEVLVDPTAEAVVGSNEALHRIPALYRAYRLLAHRLERDHPQALVLIDFPEFNLRLARRARRAGVPVVYFIPPQLWAWRRWRVRAVRRHVTRVLAVLPLELPLYRGAGVPVEFVGHPLLDAVPLDLGPLAARERLGIDPDQPLIGLLPGSRPLEVARLLPAMLEASRILARADARRRVVLALADSVDAEAVRAAVAAARARGGPDVELFRGRTYEIMAGADTLLAASGTASLEAALLGAPMVVCYRVSRMSYEIARRLITVPWIGLPNLIANRALVPELIQDDLTGARLAALAEPLLGGGAAAALQRAGFKEVRALLGEPGVGRRAAAAVLAVARGAGGGRR
ncbi:MAG: lipid-A-disaccharide synthase [Candidatus Rokubacteria bacterium]|nr:lipid-A-disaccharide synthase [Candidatus Rokubacteria bacterium]